MSFQELIAPRREANPPLSVYSCASAYDKIKSRAHCYGNEMRSLKWNLISWVLLETMSTASDKRKRTRRILSLLMLFSKQEKSACVLCVYKEYIQCETDGMGKRETHWHCLLWKATPPPHDREHVLGVDHSLQGPMSGRSSSTTKCTGVYSSLFTCFLWRACRILCCKRQKHHVYTWGNLNLYNY